MSAGTGTRAATAGRIADLAPIRLEELVARADMLTRVDRKYVLTRDELPQVLGDVDPATRVLEIAGQREQPYRSTYLDTPDLESFLGAAHPRRRRFKVRTRVYGDCGAAFLEVKTRGPRGVTVKDRLPVPAETAVAQRLTGPGRDWVAQHLRALGRRPGLVDELRPELRCEYTRTTLYPPQGDGRVTIDWDLVWSEATGRWVSCPDLVIVETKSGASPSRMDHLLWSCGLRPARISKFGTGMAVLRPGLPANRWARTLRRPELEGSGAALVPDDDPRTPREPGEPRHLHAHHHEGHLL